MVKNLAEASKEERKKRGMYITTGGTFLGGIFGQVIGGFVGFVVAGGSSKLLGKAHDKKLEKVMNM